MMGSLRREPSVNCGHHRVVLRSVCDRAGLAIEAITPAADDPEDELAKLDGAVAALPASLKEPLLLSLTENMTHRDIAEALGLSTKAVEVRIYRAKRALAAALGTHSDVQ